MPEAWLDGRTGPADNIVGEEKGPSLPTQPSYDLKLSFLRLGAKLIKKFIAFSFLKEVCTGIDQLSKKRPGVFHNFLSEKWGNI